MRVLFVTHAFPRREDDVAGAFILRLARALKNAGVEIDILAPAAAGLAAMEAMGGVTVHRYRYSLRAWETLAYEGTMAEQVSAGMSGKIALLGMIGGARSATSRLMRQLKPDLVHAHWWFPSGLAASYAPATTPLVVTLHGSDVRFARKTAFAPRFFRKVSRRAAAMTAVSEWLASGAREIGSDKPITVAPMPVDVARFEPNLGNRSKSVLFVGRLNEQKGAADLLAAATTIASDATVDFVGDGPLRPQLEATARQQGIGSRVRWHGALPQSAVVSLYRQASVVAIPSREEGLGLVAVEAQLTGTPVVAYRSGGVTELVDDGTTGILTPVGDVSALAGSINALLADPSRARRMGSEGRARMAGTFSPDTAAATYRRIYQQALAR